MGTFNWLVLVTLLIVTQHTSAQSSISEAQASLTEISFKTDDEFMLMGHYFPGEPEQAGVLMLHDCASDSTVYRDLAKSVAKSGIHALTLDLRGFGKSTSEQYSHATVKKSAKDIVTYQSGLVSLTAYWQQDVLLAFNYLKKQMNDKGHIAVVSAGCSAPYAVQLAEKMRLGAVVLVSPKLEYMDKEKYKNLIDFPAYFMAAAFDVETYQTSVELYQWNGDPRSTMQIFKGEHSGYSLLRRQSFLTENIAQWLQYILIKDK